MILGYRYAVLPNSRIVYSALTVERHHSKKKDSKKPGEEEEESEGSEAEERSPHTNDLYPLPYKSGRFGHEAVKQYNDLGFGAGGLPPLTFSHLSRNWSQLTGIGFTQDTEECEEGEDYGPRVELSKLPWTEMETDYHINEGMKQENDGMGTTEELPPHPKRRKVMLQPAAGARKVLVPSRSVRQHDGGRGKPRFRLKRALESGSDEWIVD